MSTSKLHGTQFEGYNNIQYNAADTLIVNHHQSPDHEPRSVRPPWILPRQAADIYAGYTSVSDELKECLLGPQPENEDEQVVFVLVGMGGVGKTESVLQFLKSNDRALRQRFWAAFWIDCSSETTIRAGFKSISHMLGWHQDDMDFLYGAKDQLDDFDMPCLLFLEDCDHPGADFRRYIPNNPKISTILTTRVHKLVEYATGHSQNKKWCLQLHGLDSESATELFLESSGIRERNDVTFRQATHIVRDLGCYPLAIVVASSLVSNSTYSLEQYAEAVAQRLTQRKLLYTQSESLRYKTFSTTFDISAEALQALSTVDPSARHALGLLDLLAFIDCRGVSDELFLRAWTHGEETRAKAKLFTRASEGHSEAHYHTDQHHDDVSVLSMWHVDRSCQYLGPAELIKRKRAFGKSRAHLIRMSLAKLDSPGTSFSMHPVVHAWASERIEHKSESWTAAASFLALSIRGGSQWENPTAEIVRHIEKIVAFNPSTSGSSLEFSQIWYVFAWQLHYADSDHALEVCKVLVQAIRTLPAGCSVKTSLAEAQFLLGASYLRSGNALRATEMLELAVNAQDRLAKNHRLASQYELARAYQAVGAITKAVDQLEQVVKVREEISETSPTQLASLHRLAELYTLSGRFLEAAEMLELVVTIQSERLPADHPSRLVPQCELATAYLEPGRIFEAVEILESVVTVQEKLSAHDPDRLKAHRQLGIAYMANGQVPRAIEIFEHVAKTQESLVERHPDRLASLHNLAEAYLANKQVSRAIEILEHEVRMRQDMPKEHPARLSSQEQLAVAYLANGQHSLAVSLLEQVVNLQKTVLPEEHPDGLRAQHELGRAYHLCGRTSEAKTLLLHVVTLKQHHLPAGHPDRAVSQDLLVLIDAAKDHLASLRSCNPPDPSQSFGDSHFHDSGIGSSMQQHIVPGLVEAETSDVASINTTANTIPLTEDQKSHLEDVFVNRLISGIRHQLKSQPAPSELEHLLKDFAIIAKKAAGANVAYRVAVDFVRRRRHIIAASFDDTAKTELQYQFSTHVSSADRMKRLYFLDPDETPLDDYPQAATTSSPMNSIHPPGKLSDHSEIIRDDEAPRDHPEQKLLQAAQTALLDSDEFRWLVQRVTMLTSRSCPDGSYHAIRRVIANHLDRTSSESELKLTLPWDPVDFLENQFEPERRELCQVLVYCGSATSSAVCTVVEYLEDVWPSVFHGVIACLESACKTVERRGSRADIASATLTIKLHDGFTTISIYGRPQSKLEIAEACIWLATACRENGAGDHPTLCSPQLDESTLEMRLHYEPATEPGLPVNGSCWLGMLRNPVVATGYPIPPRNDNIHQKGLEAQIDVLVALSGANWATKFRDKFLFIGLRTALVPVWESESSVVWHFLATDSVEDPMTYDKAHAFHADVSVSSVTAEEMFGIQRRRHFVGIWTSSARVLAGTSPPGTKLRNFYGLHQSDSQKIDHVTMTPNTLSFTGGKYFTVGGGFALGKKDARLPVSPAGYFESLLNETEHWKVLLYGSADSRAWLVDGHSALLHVSIAWLFARARERIDDFDFGPQRPGHPDARSVLMSNRSLAIYQIPEGHKVETIRSLDLSASSDRLMMDSGYGSGSTTTRAAIRQDSKSSESEFTVETLVTEFYQLMRLMLATLSDSKQTMPQVPIKMPTTSPMLVGWEIADIILQNSPMGHHHARTIQLQHSAAEWLRFTKDIGAIVLLARTFGDIILPETSGALCGRTRPVEEGRDYPAVLIYMLQGDDRLRHGRGNDHSKGCLQINDDYFWHDFDPHLARRPCACKRGTNCKTQSRLGKAAKEHANVSSRALGPLNVFEVFPDGAAIIAGPNKLPPMISNSPATTSESHLQPNTLRRKWEKLKVRIVALLKREV